MEPDKFQEAWQAQAARTRVAVDADLLWKEVQRNQQVFRTIIFWRDFREIGVALVMIPLWFWMGYAISLPWTWHLTVPALVWVAGFMLVYRWRYAPPTSGPDISLLECARHSLTEVENQIWLLRNMHWWYLVPPGVSISIFFVDISWRTGAQTGTWLIALVTGAFLCLVLVGMYTALYYVNQHAVRTQLEPRRQELLTLLTSLDDETPRGD